MDDHNRAFESIGQTEAGPNDEGETTELFLHLTPEKVLEAVDAGGLETRPVCYPLASFENRVYEVELADRSRVVAKFYRPGRWSRGQILEEHALLDELDEDELPICAARAFPDGETLHQRDGLYYALWDRRGGRAPDELSHDLAMRLGMLIGRMHIAGARQDFAQRPRLDADRYIRRQVAFMVRERQIPRPFEARYRRAAEGVADLADAELLGLETLRLHGDLHLGNILLRDDSLRLLDFDDACSGPAVQDLWLAIPGRDPHSERLRASLVEGYERFRIFDHSQLRLIEVLRGLRLVRYCGWLARRREDPAFQRGWPHFGSEDYWLQETADLEEQLEIIKRRPRSIGAAASSGLGATGVEAGLDAEEPLTNKDYFWDWPGD